MSKLAYAAAAALCISALAMLVLAVLLLSAWSDVSTAQAELNKTNARLEGARAELASANEAVARKESEIAQREAENENLTQMLAVESEKAYMLSLALDEKEAELEEASQTLAEASEEIGRIRDETESMSERINQSIQWFSANADLPQSLKYDRFLSKVKKGCADGGTLRLACVSHLMEDELNIRYKDDPTGDRLYSIDEIVQRGGGDCEDFALFFKAALNRLSAQGYDFEAWEEGFGRYDIYEDGSTIWYIDSAGPVGLGSGPNTYAACYYYDTAGAEWFGHCIIMLTKRDITGPDDISNAALSDAVFFEPQNGEYMGRMGRDFTACADGEEECDDRENAVQFIITDDDLYEFNEGKWSHYHGQLARTQEILDELDSISTERQ